MIDHFLKIYKWISGKRIKYLANRKVSIAYNFILYVELILSDVAYKSSKNDHEKTLWTSLR